MNEKIIQMVESDDSEIAMLGITLACTQFTTIVEYHWLRDRLHGIRTNIPRKNGLRKSLQQRHLMNKIGKH